jgi:superfamily II DNA or RNA helicase
MPHIQSKVDLQPHQVRFAKAFMKMTDKPFGKWGGIAVHSLGSGKTMTAITTSQMYLNKYPTDKIIVITPASLVTNFQKELVKWGVVNQDMYHFFTPDGFKNKPMDCTNSLLIIDEAHNLRTQVKLDDATKTKIGKTKVAAKRQNKKNIILLKQAGSNFTISGPYTEGTPENVIRNLIPNCEFVVNDGKFIITCSRSDRAVGDPLAVVTANYKLFSKDAVIDITGGAPIKNRNKGMKTADIINCSKKARFVLLLTGTPVVNDMYDIENLMAMVYKRDPLTKYKFDKMNADAMAEYFKCAISMYNTMDNVDVKKDFPDKLEHNIFITMTPDYLEKYKIVEENLVDQLGAVGFKDDKDITRFYNGLRQATTKIDNENSPKVKWILDLLNKSSPKEKFVVFSHFKDGGVGLLSKTFDKNKISYEIISGEVPKPKRQQYVDDYNKNKIKVLIITKAGGEGLNLLETRAIILIEPSWNETTSNQVIGRAVRYKSHSNLPKEDQIVDVYKLYMLKPYEKEVMNKTMGKYTLSEIVEILENDPKAKANGRPSIDIFLKGHSMTKQDKLDRFVDFFKSIPSFEECYIKGETIVQQGKLKGITTKKFTDKDKVTFEVMPYDDNDNDMSRVDELFTKVFPNFSKENKYGIYTYTVSPESIIKLTNDNIANFMRNINMYKAKTKSTDPQIKAIVAKLNLKNVVHVYLPDNDLEALHFIIYIQNKNHNVLPQVDTIMKNNPLTKNAVRSGPIERDDFTNMIYTFIPDETRDVENRNNMKQLHDKLRKLRISVDMKILSKKKNIYASKMVKYYYS